MSNRTAQEILNHKKKFNVEFQELLFKVSEEPNNYPYIEPQRQFTCLFKNTQGHVCGLACKRNITKTIDTSIIRSKCEKNVNFKQTKFERIVPFRSSRINEKMKSNEETDDDSLDMDLDENLFD